MIAIPALDLKAGACVQVVPNSREEFIRIPDAVGVALAWRQYGFRCLHVIDLDRVTRRGSNNLQIEGILGSTDADVNIGGGVRTRDSIEWLLNEGAKNVIVGTRALEDFDWLEEMSTTFPDQILVAVDVRDRRVFSHGWTRTHQKLVSDVVEELNTLPLAGLLATAVQGHHIPATPDLSLMEDLAESAEFPIFAGGDIARVSDLRTLADRGIAAAVIGTALYSGEMDPRAIADEFSA
jgi:phosphoribosylformimino-5-aminoimidazole carboxamide ribotide isomerase